ncbi:hypothetical protein M758_2G243600 [Ceratodon purpureus]|nr:hypothetical protein M758_2G243600 [Ceratodon purpureus]
MVLMVPMAMLMLMLLLLLRAAPPLLLLPLPPLPPSLPLALALALALALGHRSIVLHACSCLPPSHPMRPPLIPSLPFPSPLPSVSPCYSIPFHSARFSFLFSVFPVPPFSSVLGSAAGYSATANHSHSSFSKVFFDVFIRSFHSFLFSSFLFQHNLVCL